MFNSGNHSTRYRNFGAAALIIIISLVTPYEIEAENAFPDKNIVTAVVPAEFPPHYSLDKRGNPQGFAIDIMDKIAEAAGLKVRYAVKDSWGDVFDDLRSGRADLIPNLGITENRKLDFDFTLPVETFPISIFVRKGMKGIKGQNDLSGRKVAAVKNNMAVKLLEGREDINLTVFDDAREALFDLLAGHMDALVYPETVTRKLAQTIRVEDRIKLVGKPLIELKRAIAVRKGNTVLLDRLNKAVDAFQRTEEFNRIFVKWHGKPTPFWTVSRVTWMMGGIIVLSIAVVLIWRYRTVARLNINLMKTIEERKQAEEELIWKSKFIKLLQEVTAKANESKSTKEILQFCIDKVRVLTKWPIGRVYMVSEDDPDLMVPASIWSLENDTQFKEFRNKTTDFKFPIGGGLPGRVLASGKPAWITDVRTDPSFARTELAQEVDLISAFAFPILSRSSVSAVLEFYSAKAMEPDEQLLEIMAQIGTQAGRVVERKQANEELRSAKQLLEKTFASLDEAVFVVSPENRTIIACNPAVERLFGYTKEEIIGSNTEFLHVDKASYEEFGKNMVAGLEPNGNYRAEYRMKKKDGTVFTCDHTVTEIRDESGKCTELVTVFSDITEKRMIEQELAKAQKLESLGLLAGGIAHDFNNILMGILGNISIAKFLTGSDNRSIKVLSEAEKAAKRARGLTKQLLTFASGSTPLMKVTRINNLLKEVTQFALRGSNSRVELKPAKNLAPVEIDSDQITQVINNLVINADQAMPDGGIVTVSADNATLEDGEEYPLPAGDYVKISVEDNGIGITDENLDRIFDPFFTTKNRGNGLGLSSSYSIAKNHGGLIKVSSKPGKGATFTIYLPAIDKPVSRKKKKIKTIKGTKNILVMDDDEMVREVLYEMLTELGYKPKMAKEGKEAVEKYRRAMKKGEPFAAVILDHTIKGGMGGLKTIEKLIEMDPDVNAIISSGYTTDLFMTDYEQFGFSGFVEKPYELEMLSQLLDKTITAKRQLSVLPQLGLS